MDAGRALVLARKWWWLLIAGMVLAAGAFLVASLSSVFSSSRFQASTTMLVAYEGSAGQSVNARSYAEMMAGRPVIDRTVSELGLSSSVEAVVSRVHAQVRSGTQLIDVVASGETAAEAELLAGGVATSFISFHEEQGLPGSVFIYEPAFAGESVSEDGTAPVEVGLAAAFGLVAATGVVLTIDYLRGPTESVHEGEMAVRPNAATTGAKEQILRPAVPRREAT